MKFLIDKEDPRENSYVGHRDGKLYVNDTEEPYDVNKYCMEIISRPKYSIMEVRKRSSTHTN